MVLSEQVLEDHGASMFNGGQLIDHIEEDDHTDNVVEDDGTNTLIHDSVNVKMDDDNDDVNENIDDFDDVHYIPLLDKEYEPLYEGSKTNLLSAVLLIMNLKVMNGLSNISITWMLSYVKIIHHIYVDVIVTLGCIHLYFLCIVPRCLFWEVFVIIESCHAPMF